MITRETLSELLSFDPQQYLTTTLYLQIDGSSQPSYAIELKYLIKSRKTELNNKDLEAEILKSIGSDIRKIKDFVTLKFSREGVRTLIVFSCSGKKWWKTLTLKLPLRSRLVVNSKPYLRPLNFLLEDYRRFLVVLVERSKARLFEVFAGEIQEHSSVLDEVPGKVRVGGYSGYEEKRIARHIEDHVHRHLRHVAEAACELFRQCVSDSVLLCGTEQNTNEFHHYLPSMLHDRIVGTFHEDINTSLKTILERTMKVELEIRQNDEKKLLERLFNQVNSGGLGIVGLDSTIRALQQGQVNFLVVQEGYGKTGFRCTDCFSLLTNDGSCDYCGGKTQIVGDIVDAAIQQALLQGCQVKYITLEGSQLSAAGNIGAMLRFKV